MAVRGCQKTLFVCEIWSVVLLEMGLWTLSQKELDTKKKKKKGGALSGVHVSFNSCVCCTQLISLQTLHSFITHSAQRSCNQVHRHYYCMAVAEKRAVQVALNGIAEGRREGGVCFLFAVCVEGSSQTNLVPRLLHVCVCRPFYITAWFSLRPAPSHTPTGSSPVTIFLSPTQYVSFSLRLFAFYLCSAFTSAKQPPRFFFLPPLLRLLPCRVLVPD